MKQTLLLAGLLSGLLVSCMQQKERDRPNVILVMADDMGYECLGVYGASSYKTPNLDRLAGEGIRFENCISQPLCTPSRVKLMTGRYNYRNYEFFGYLNAQEPQIGRLMKQAGYATCIAGKWQLNGLAYKDQIPEWNDASRPHQMGFDEYCLWQLTHSRGEGERFADPLIEENGSLRECSSDDYGPDIFTRFILDFIDKRQEGPFFVYYPMVLVHEPFVPTPDCPDWRNEELRYHRDTAYFKEMVNYTDQIIGKIVEKLEELDILDHTVLIFTGDNGTHPSIYTPTDHGLIRGGKGNTTLAGTHVPLIAHFPDGGQKGLRYEGLVEFSDFYPTLADLAGVECSSDGHSFHPLLVGEKQTARSSTFVHYDPRWGENVNRYRNQFVQTAGYKLYSNGDFYDLEQDILEMQALNRDSLSEDQQETFEMLHSELEKHPAFRY